MGKKMKLPFLYRNNSVKVKSSWPPWPSCHQPRTLSFRTDDSLPKTVNSAYVDAIIEAETPESGFSNSPESASFSKASDESRGDPVETVIRGLRSERLFFEPGRDTSSILEEAKPPSDGSPFKESVVLSMESQHPFVDFRKSMAEMVEAHGLKDWKGLEELLCWYLGANGKSNHEYIVGAFLGLLVELAISSTSSSSIPSTSNCSHSPSSPLSFHTFSSSSDDSSTTSTPCVSSLKAEEEIDNSHRLSFLSSEADQKDIIEDNKDDASSSSLLDV